MMASADRLLELAYTLLARSKSGAIKWVAAEGTDAFVYSGSKAAVVVRTQDRDGQAPYLMTLYDGAGSAVEGASSTDNDEWHFVLADLYQLARRSALSIDEVLDSLLSDLGGPAGPPETSPPIPKAPRGRAPDVDADIDDLPF